MLIWYKKKSVKEFYISVNMIHAFMVWVGQINITQKDTIFRKGVWSRNKIDVHPT